VKDDIKINEILSNSPGASLSRFQFMIFTFTISFCYLMILLYQLLHACDAATIKTACDVARLRLPDGTGAAILLGISGGGYALGKGIQTSGDTATKNAEVTANAAASAAGAAATGQQTVAQTVTTIPGGGASGTVTSTTPVSPQGSDGET
jgi:hypothetical protein